MTETLTNYHNRIPVNIIALVLFGFCLVASTRAAAPPEALSAASESYTTQIKPLLKQYCLGCHSTEKHKGSLDLERFASISQVRKEVKPWQAMLEMLETGEMPPKKKPQPIVDERQRLIGWLHDFLDAEARARAGDPGFVPLRRLSNSEYDYTIRDLTGVDLQPASSFPADGAAGEGFTNAAESLSDISPALLNKYLLAAKDLSAHAVLLPDGFRFSAGKTRRDWSDESLAQLRKFYSQFTSDGRLPLAPYVAATLHYRDALLGSRISIEAVATKERLNPKYLGILWKILANDSPSLPLAMIRAHWRATPEKDGGGAIVAEIAAWQAKLWKVVPIGSYRYGNTVRGVANDTLVEAAQTLRLAAKSVNGQRDVVLYLNTRELFPTVNAGSVVWSRPRLEGANKPVLLLRDYAKFGHSYEVDYAALFADTARYLGAVVEAASDRNRSSEQIAKEAGLNAALLKRWITVLDVERSDPHASELELASRVVPTLPLELLTEKDVADKQKLAINGWRSKAGDLPIALSNSSDVEEHIPGRASPHKVVVHPMPTEFVAATWTSPIEGSVRVQGKVSHAHVGCGNGIAWWLERRHADRANVVAEGTVAPGGETELSPRTLSVSKGDLLILAIDAKDRDHSCDLTEISLNITDPDKPAQTWDLAGDVADKILEGNPHADKLGNKDVWSFVKGPTRPLLASASLGAAIPGNSILGRWRRAASDPAKRSEAEKLAHQFQLLLVGSPPAREDDPDRFVHERLASVDGILLQGLDLSSLGISQAHETHYGLEPSRFGTVSGGKPLDDASVAAPANSAVEVRLPAAIMKGREFVVDVRLDGPSADRAAQFELLTTPPVAEEQWSEKGAVAVSPDSAAKRRLLAGFDEFRQTFPLFICYPAVIPVDEVVCLKMYHREDEPLIRLFLNYQQHQEIDHLWTEHRFITQQPVAENRYLPLFIGFVTQDQPKELLDYFEGQRDTFRKRAEDCEKDVTAAIPAQMQALLDFAARAYRRPLQETERAQLGALYQSMLARGMPHDEAFRAVLARIFVAPSFLFRIEQPPAGKEAGAVNDWELATRLSYFLWSSVPDDVLQKQAAAGQLHDPAVLAEQAQRMLSDDRVRALAIEFGTQWIHVRGFDQFKEKSEKLYPEFDEKLRGAMYEESILFFQDLFQHAEPVERILDANYAYLNDALAKHYGIPGVSGPQFRKVDGVRKFGRGGILALASVQAKQAGAARTSPVLRGNWVVETLLGEKLPRPPPDVPRLPEEEGTGNLTMRQLVEKHTQIESCAVCHQRMDPIGFSFERYDSIGRLREKESTGLPIDCHAKLKGGTEFEGIDGLRTYLLTKKKDVIIRLFCRRLLGYALGRTVSLSDQSLLDEMVAALNQNDGRVSAAVLQIVRSPQFRSIRGSAYAEED